jgi:hypothetical protein
MRARQTLLILGSLPFTSLSTIHAQSVSAQPSPPFTLSGIVRDDSKTPISNAELKLARKGEVARLARTGPDGRFDFGGVQPGDVELTARRMGYKAATLNIKVSGATAPGAVEFALVTVPMDVPAVVVEGQNDRLREFYERRSSNNFGKYFDGNEIVRRDPHLLSDLLRTIPGAVIGSASRVQNRVLLRGCKPSIWENGMKVFGAEVDDVANPSDVAGMEIYLSWAGLPPQYQDRENPGCGAIILWTRDH